MDRPSKTKKPVRTKERYILDSLTSVFRGGHWVDDVPVSEIGGEGVSQPENYEQPLYVTVIGGQKYDESALYDALAPYQHYVVGVGRGVESYIPKVYMEGEFTAIPVDPDRFGKNARKVNVEQVLSFAPESPLLLVGSGERVKQARAWLKRARWPREVIELP